MAASKLPGVSSSKGDHPGTVGKAATARRAVFGGAGPGPAGRVPAFRCRRPQVVSPAAGTGRGSTPAGPRPRLGSPCREDPADHQGVVTGRHALFGVALQGRQGAADQGRAARPRRAGRGCPAKRRPVADAALHGEPAGDVALARGEHGDGPPGLLGEQVVHAGAVAQADQDQRRVEGDRHEGGRGHPDVLARGPRGVVGVQRRLQPRSPGPHRRPAGRRGGAELVVAHPLSMPGGEGLRVRPGWRESGSGALGEGSRRAYGKRQCSRSRDRAGVLDFGPMAFQGLPSGTGSVRTLKHGRTRHAVRHSCRTVRSVKRTERPNDVNPHPRCTFYCDLSHKGPLIC
ncbi:hypothetical protein SGLAM104S_07004 [Streptomyces glaucescens]